VSAVLAVARHWKRAVPRHVQFGNAGVARVVMLELLCLPAALWIGSVRGWTVATFGLHISWRGTATGVLLFAALLAGAALFGAVLKALHVEVAGSFFLKGTTLPYVLLLSIVNPLYEEVILSGYFIHALQHLGMWPAVLASALFTSFLHAYLVLQSVTLVLFTRIAVGLAYWRGRQLWPLIVAHSLADLFALLYRQPSGAVSSGTSEPSAV